MFDTCLQATSITTTTFTLDFLHLHPVLSQHNHVKHVRHPSCTLPFSPSEQFALETFTMTYWSVANCVPLMCDFIVHMDTVYRASFLTLVIQVQLKKHPLIISRDHLLLSRIFHLKLHYSLEKKSNRILNRPPQVMYRSMSLAIPSRLFQLITSIIGHGNLGTSST